MLGGLCLPQCCTMRGRRRAARPEFPRFLPHRVAWHRPERSVREKGRIGKRKWSLQHWAGRFPAQTPRRQSRAPGRVTRLSLRVHSRAAHKQQTCHLYVAQPGRVVKWSAAALEACQKTATESGRQRTWSVTSTGAPASSSCTTQEAWPDRTASNKRHACGKSTPGWSSADGAQPIIWRGGGGYSAGSLAGQQTRWLTFLVTLQQAGHFDWPYCAVPSRL